MADEAPRADGRGRRPARLRPTGRPTTCGRAWPWRSTSTTWSPPLRLARELQPWFGVAKVGLELYSAAGPEAITRLVELGYDVFVDLKLHDIPTTVDRAARVLGALGARYLTLHAAGGGPDAAGRRRGLPRGRGRRRAAEPTSLGGHRAHERRRRAAAHAAQRVGVGARGRLRRHRVRGRRPRRRSRQLAPAPLARRARHPPGGRARRRPGPRVATPREALDAGADLLVIGRDRHPRPTTPSAAAARPGGVARLSSR